MVDRSHMGLARVHGVLYRRWMIVGLRGSSVLRHTRANGDGSLDTSQERRAVYDDLVFSPLASMRGMEVATFHRFTVAIHL